MSITNAQVKGLSRALVATNQPTNQTEPNRTEPTKGGTNLLLYNNY